MKTAREEIGVLIKLIKPSAVCVLSDRMFSNWQKEMTLINYLDIQSCVAVCIIRVQMLGCSSRMQCVECVRRCTFSLCMTMTN